MVTPSTFNTTGAVAHLFVTDLTIRSSSIHEMNLRGWHCIDKDLYLHTSEQSEYLYIALMNKEELTAGDLLVVGIRVGEPPSDKGSGYSWENRPGGIWLLRSPFPGNIDQAVTEVDVLFGTDAVDPRPQWNLMRSPIQLDAHPQVPVARLSVLHGRAKPRPDARTTLRVKEDGKFKIVQISDTHMVTGVGVCKDAIDAHGKNLPESEADKRTIHFIGEILDVEKPHLVILTGDQLHHDIPDSQSALFKVVAPMIERSIPFAIVFGNHDSEGPYALSRIAQMSILENLPCSLSEPGPEEVDGIGNFYLQQNQIDWFTSISQAQRSRSEKNDNDENRFHLSLAFIHIPLPEFGDRHIRIYAGHRGEPTEGPSSNSHFYDALVKEKISALGCGHDHVNDFCALLPHQGQKGGDKKHQSGPWLCYGGGTGFGGYCSYGRKRFHRRMRVWELDTSNGILKTWTRVEYSEDRVNELVLARGGAIVVPPGEEDASKSCVVS
ncbi:Metallo-dependent phosphatase-like protein [Xylaria telfairii]|nr:Metallo-dependent phosphatase-like protein [Xylaria telfairii]